MDNIARWRNPFKIVCEVILPIPILVVTHFSRLALPYKRIYDQMMDKIGLFMPIAIQDNSWVSMDWGSCQQAPSMKPCKKFVRPPLTLIANAVNRTDSPVTGYLVQTDISLHRMPLFHRKNKWCTLNGSHADTSHIGMGVVSPSSVCNHDAGAFSYEGSIA